MPKFKIRVTHVYRVQADTTVEVEADDADAAADLISQGEIDLPNITDKRWNQQWVLQNEEGYQT